MENLYLCLFSLGLKRRLGITAWREFSEDMTQVRDQVLTSYELNPKWFVFVPTLGTEHRENSMRLIQKQLLGSGFRVANIIPGLG